MSEAKVEHHLQSGTVSSGTVCIVSIDVPVIEKFALIINSGVQMILMNVFHKSLISVLILFNNLVIELDFVTVLKIGHKFLTNCILILEFQIHM